MRLSASNPLTHEIGIADTLDISLHNNPLLNICSTNSYTIILGLRRRADSSDFGREHRGMFERVLERKFTCRWLVGTLALL